MSLVSLFKRPEAARAVLYFFTALILMKQWIADATPFDFSAFYCGGRTVLAHADPYAFRALSSCELRVFPAMGITLWPGEILPVPFPGATLAVFSLFARLDPWPAFILWTTISGLLYLASVAALRALTGLGYPLIVAVTAVPIVSTGVIGGQLTPIVFGCFLIALWASTAGRPRLAALAVTATLLEPHLGLPMWLGIFIASARSRVALVAGALAFIALNFSVQSPAQLFRYVHAVLPAHAFSEVHHYGQFSLTHILSVLGVSDAAALRAGSIDYAAMTVLGCVVAYALTLRRAEKALAAAAVPAFTSIGGPFLHLHQIAVVNISALLLCAAYKGRDAEGTSRAPGRGTALLLIVLALPLTVAGQTTQCLTYMLLSWVILMDVPAMPVGQKILTGLFVFAISFASLMQLQHVYHLLPSVAHPHRKHAVQAFTPTDDPDVRWREVVDMYYTWQGITAFYIELPLLLACISVAGLLGVRAFKPGGDEHGPTPTRNAVPLPQR